MTSARTEDSPDVEVQEIRDPATFTLENGIELALREASPFLMKTISEEVAAAQPKPPMVMNTDKGREEPNESDPDYRLAFAQWASDSGWRTLHTVCATCVTVTHVPEAIYAHDTDEWVDEVAVVYGLVIEPNPRRRLAQWLLLQTTDSDLLDLSPLLMHQVGAPEEDVRRALDNFLGVAKRDTDTASAANGSGPDGDTVRALAGGGRAARRRASRGAS